MVRNPGGFDRGSAYASDEEATKESLIGTERFGRPSNVSWGSIFAGVMTFLAVTVLLSLVTAGIGLGGSGVGAGIWSIIALAIALAAAGYVAGVLAVRSGLMHGFLTWATSLVVTLALTVWFSAGLLGAVGNIVGSAAEAVSGTDITQTQDAQQTAEEVADTAQTSAWWGFVGLLLGAVIAALGGMLGVRNVVSSARRFPDDDRLIE